MAYQQQRQGGCPAQAYAVRACPFLAQVAQAEGPAYAASIARDPSVPAAVRGCQPLLPESETSPAELLATFGLFHGPEGVVPLSGFTGRAESLADKLSSGPLLASSASDAPAVVQACPAGLPLASMSMGFGRGVSCAWRGRQGLAQRGDAAAAGCAPSL